MKVKLMEKIPAKGYRVRPEGGQVPVLQYVPIAEIIVQCTENTQTFEEADRVQSLREKAKSAIENETSTAVELTDDEFERLFIIFSRRGTDEKIALRNVIEQDNEIDLVEYEKSFRKKIATRV